jgi:hypothetical protein
MKVLVTLLFPFLLGGALAPPAEKPCPTARNDTDFVYAQPRLVKPVEPLTTVIAPGAVLASEMQTVDPALRETDGPIAVESPLARFAAGTPVGTRLVEGEVRPCIYWGTKPYQPPHDEEGRSFPTICLEDPNGDGAYERVRFFAYGAAAGKGIVESAIKPVRLRPHNREPDPVDSMMRLHRRLRVVAAADDRARLVVEHAYQNAFSGDTEPEYNAGPAFEQEIGLAEGEREVGGVRLNFLKIGEAWTAVPLGGFRPWLTYSCGNARIRFLAEERG